MCSSDKFSAVTLAMHPVISRNSAFFNTLAMSMSAELLFLDISSARSARLVDTLLYQYPTNDRVNGVFPIFQTVQQMTKLMVHFFHISYFPANDKFHGSLFPYIILFNA